VRAVEAGEMPHNHEIEREANTLSSRLPVLEAERSKPEFYTQCNDAALLTYLGVIMKSCNKLNQSSLSTSLASSTRGRERAGG
jgi:hypothetical protein